MSRPRTSGRMRHPRANHSRSMLSCRMPLGAISAWWHMGEEDAIAVYRRRIWFESVIAIALGAPLAGLWIVRFREWFLLVPGALFLLFRVLAEKRQAVIFSRDSVKYRPTFGAPRSVRLSEIADTNKCQVLLSFDWHAVFVSGVKLMLIDGSSFVLPLNFPNSKEILTRLPPTEEGRR